MGSEGEFGGNTPWYDMTPSFDRKREWIGGGIWLFLGWIWRSWSETRIRLWARIRVPFCLSMASKHEEANSELFDSSDYPTKLLPRITTVLEGVGTRIQLWYTEIRDLLRYILQKLQRSQRLWMVWSSPVLPKFLPSVHILWLCSKLTSPERETPKKYRTDGDQFMLFC